MQTYSYLNRQEYTKDAQAYSWRKQQETANTGNNILRDGMAVLLYRKDAAELVIFAETRRECIEARVNREGEFKSVLIISQVAVVKVTDAAEIAALPVYAELCRLYEVAQSNRLFR